MYSTDNWSAYLATLAKYEKFYLVAWAIKRAQFSTNLLEKSLVCSPQLPTKEQEGSNSKYNEDNY